MAASQIKGWDPEPKCWSGRVFKDCRGHHATIQLTKQVKIETAGGKIFAVGPEEGDYQWNVSYEIFAPRRSDLSLEAYNGGIDIAPISGRIAFTGHNGGVVLKCVGGTVRGATTNGCGVVVELDGARGTAKRLDVRTTNCGIVMSVPENNQFW